MRSPIAQHAVSASRSTICVSHVTGKSVLSRNDSHVLASAYRESQRTMVALAQLMTNSMPSRIGLQGLGPVDAGIRVQQTAASLRCSLVSSHVDAPYSRYCESLGARTADSFS